MDPYNYETFFRSQFREDMHFDGGPLPGDPAPDFELPLADGGVFRLSAFRDVRPVLIQFGSLTCPLSLGSSGPVFNLYTEFGPRVEFVNVYVREAHPGERYPHHTSEAQKLRHASDWKRLDPIYWPVAADVLEGTVHRVWGLLPNAVYLIDRSGHVAYRAPFAGQEKLLRSRIRELLDYQEAGVDQVSLGEQESLVIPLAPMGDSFDRALARGGRQAEENFRRELGDVIYDLQKIPDKVA